MARQDKSKRALGGAIKRIGPSRAATLIHDMGLATGRVLDFGCGYGVDAKNYGWYCYDPYYKPRLPDGLFDTIVCISVINALSCNNRAKVLASIQQLLSADGKALLSVPRDLPRSGKLGMHHSLQNYVVLTLPSIYSDTKLEIYQMNKGSVFKDKTRDFLSRRDQRRLK